MDGDTHKKRRLLIDTHLSDKELSSASLGGTLKSLRYTMTHENELFYPLSLIYLNCVLKKERRSRLKLLKNIEALFHSKKHRVNYRSLQTIEALLSHIIQIEDIPVITVQRKIERPLRILFLQRTPCIRNYKYAASLKKRGHTVTLAYIEKRLTERYKLSEDVYEEVVAIDDFTHFWTFSEKFDVIHSHNEPDDFTVLAIGSTKPVIHDTHDLMSLRTETSTFQSKVMESIANKLCIGRISVSPYLIHQINTMYGPHYETVIYNYAHLDSSPPVRREKLSQKDGNVHIVYEGGIIPGHSYRDPSSLFIELARHGYEIHVYPVEYDPQVEASFSGITNIHYEHPVSPSELIEVLSQYDVGIIPFNVTEKTREILNASLANKLFEYLAAGLPVLTPELASYTLFFQEHPVGATYSSTQDLLQKIPMVLCIREGAKQFLFQEQTELVERFYMDCIERNDYLKKAETFFEFKKLYQANIRNWHAFLRALCKRKRMGL